MTVDDLKKYFFAKPLPPAPIYLNPSHRIVDVNLFLESHLRALEGRELPFDKLSIPVYSRLMEFKNYLDSLEG